MRFFDRKLVGVALLMGLLVACGGGGGGGSTPAPAPTGGTDNTGGTTGGTDNTGGTTGGTDGGTDLGISGSGAPIALGTIDAFGSIFVNGVEFDTTNAEIIVDGQVSTEDDLNVGMVVTVQGSINEDRVTGSADVVIFDNELKGPIENIVVDASGEFATITVLGIDVIVERVATVFENTTFDTLAVGDLVEISGFPEGVADLRATFLEKKADFVEGESEIEIKGTVANVTDSTFELKGYTVSYTDADLSEVTDSTITNDMFVEVRGTLSGTEIIATKVETEDRIEDKFEDDDEFKVQGTIRNYVSDAEFEVNGVTVDATNAVFKPSSLTLADGLTVEIEGTWSNSILVATEIEGRRGEIEVEGPVGALSADDNTITISLVNGDIMLTVDNRTMYDDDTDAVARMGFADLAIGDFLEIEAYDDGTQLLATRVDRDDLDDEKLQGPVESFNAELNITVLGVTYSTEGAEFSGRNGEDVDAATFYADLLIGDYVKIKDKELADGIADEVEIEGGDDDGDDD
jgi:hypothetical protein